jgi:hypothetical protein
MRQISALRDEALLAPRCFAALRLKMKRGERKSHYAISNQQS